jgi:predicted nuclease of predicted toxin-antitoxin system
MKFLVDAQLPPALAHWLSTQGYEAQHVEDLGLRDAEDREIWAEAMRRDAIIVTRDEDFAVRAGRETRSPVIIWLRIGNATNRVLLQWLKPRWGQILTLLTAGQRLIEVR